MIRFLLLSILLLTGPFGFAQMLTESHLPILVVETNGLEIPDEPKINVDFGIVDNGPGEINHIDDPYNGYDGIIGIERRGSTSQFLFPKIGYGFETRLSDGSNNNVSLLGMPVENDWVLHGPYSDKTLIRNALAYNLGGKIMAWAPRTRFCELVINGEYLGIYLLTESIKEDNDRIDIATLNPDDLEGDQLTGGYVLKIDKDTGADFDGFPSLFAPIPGADQFIFFQFHDPRPDDIQPAQRAYIQQFMDDFEINLFSSNFNDPELGYHQYINDTSFIDFLFINEIARNVDGYRLSTFMYKDRDSKDGRLHMGPVWDFNIAFGNANYCEGGSTQGLALDFNQVCPGDFWLIPFWWDRLLEDENFTCKLQHRWDDLRQGIYSTDAILQTVDSLVNIIGDAADRNFQQWPVIGEPVWPNNYVGQSYESEVNYLKNWLTQRLQYLDGAFDSLCTASGSGPINIQAIEVRPNLTNGELVTFTFYLTRPGTIDLQIFDAAGRQVYQEDVGFGNTGLKQLQWEPNVAAGMYFYRLSQNGEVRFTGKLIRI